MVRPNTPLDAQSYRVVVADEFRAIFYDREKKFSPLAEVDSMQNDAAREKTGDLIVMFEGEPSLVGSIVAVQIEAARPLTLFGCRVA